jgi:integrase
MLPTFIRFHDLYERGIAKSWPQLKNLQDKYGFPKGRLIGANTRAWTENEWLTLTAQRDGNPTTGYVQKPEPGNRNRNWTTDEGNHLLRSMTAQFQAAQVRLGFVKENGKARWTMHEMRHYAGSVWLEMGHRMEDVSRMLGHGKIGTTQKYYIHHFKKQNLERDRELMIRVSDLHSILPSQPPALPSPAMRDSCEIDGEAIEIE